MDYCGLKRYRRSREVGCMSDDVSIGDWLKPSSPRASDAVINTRLEICSGCEFFSPRMSRCKKCKCFMKLKTELLHARCPIGRWS
jgi:hypothetical protein